MAITGVRREWKNIPGSRMEGDETGLRESGSASMFYIVSFDTSDDFEDREIMALTASYGGVSIPQIWSVHRYNPWWFVKSKFARPFGGPTEWLVEVNYEYVPDPLSQPVIYEWDFVVCQEPCGYAFMQPDLNLPVAITNSSGEPPDPPLMRDVYDLVVRVKRNTSGYSALLAKEYTGSINADYIWQHPPLSVRCNFWKAAMRRAGSLSYFEENLEFQFRYELNAQGTYLGWMRKFPDMGFKTKDSTQTVGTEILADNGQPISSPVLLNGMGGILPEGMPTMYRVYIDKKMLNFSNVFNF